MKPATLLLGSLVLCLLGEWKAGGAAIDPIQGEFFERHIRDAMRPLASLLAKDPSARTAQEHLRRANLPNTSFQPYLYQITGALHEHSAERQKRVEQVEGWLDAHQPLLLEIVRASSRTSDSPDAAQSVLEFSRPTPMLREVMLEIARSGVSLPHRAAEAYDMLFTQQLDDRALREEVVAKMAWMDDLHTRAELAKVLFRQAASDWALPEVHPVLVDLLSKPIAPKNYPPRGGRQALLARIELAAIGLSMSGELAGAYVELCQARIDELDAASSQDRRTGQTLGLCIERMKGTRVPELALSWKGKFLGVSGEAYRRWCVRNGLVLPFELRDVAPTEQTAEATFGRENFSGTSNRSVDAPNSKDSIKPTTLRRGGIWLVAFGLVMVILVMLRILKRKAL